jgi:AcrR family transcriptional regulator
MENKKWIRIAALEKESGVPRRTIHFYLQNGLLHAPMKTGKTMSYYDEFHLRKLRLIKDARKEGLPIAAIREHLEKNNAAQDRPEVVSPHAPAHAKESHPPPKKRAGKTRERILDIGCQLFRNKGYKQTKVSDITTAMDVGKGTFYFYFSDKKALFLECIPMIFNELFATGWERIKKIDDAKSRLETRAQMVLPVLREFCAILHLSKEAMDEPDPKIQAMGEMVYRSIRRPIASDIEKGIQKGIFRETDARIAASVFIGIMESLNDLRVFDHQSLSPAIWDTVSQLILSGLLPDSD